MILQNMQIESMFQCNISFHMNTMNYIKKHNYANDDNDCTRWLD